MQLDASTLQLVGQVVGPSGVLVVALKLILNGSKQRLVNIDERTQKTQATVEKLHDRVDKIELENAEERGYRRALQEVTDRKG